MAMRRLKRTDPDMPAGAPERPDWLRLPDHSESDVTVKPLGYLPTYAELLAPLRGTAFNILEMGVWKGDSLKMWRDAFPEATVVGVDLGPPDLYLGPNVHVITGDQSDAQLLARIRAEHAPQGFSVIIDDAAHIGQLAARSLQALYADHLLPGGFYILEDWGTGYMASWPDGEHLIDHVGAEWLDAGVDTYPAGGYRLPSHDVGMVGLVKRLVDHASAATVHMCEPDRISEPLAIEWMRVENGLAILKKPGRLPALGLG
jgi:hypothetical protein